MKDIEYNFISSQLQKILREYGYEDPFSSSSPYWSLMHFCIELKWKAKQEGIRETLDVIQSHLRTLGEK